jgi:hypothetical protein
MMRDGLPVAPHLVGLGWVRGLTWRLRQRWPFDARWCRGNAHLLAKPVTTRLAAASYRSHACSHPRGATRARALDMALL